MEVKKFRVGEREISYYSIYDVRKTFLDEIRKKKLNFELDIKIITNTNGRDFLEGTLITYSRIGSELLIEDKIKSIIPIDEAFESKEKTRISNEVVKLQTRLEKRLYMIYLGVADPEEVEGEKEDIQDTIEKENKQEEMITPKQLEAIIKFMSNLKYKDKIQEYIKTNFNKEIEHLTKQEAGQVISFINTLLS